ncbi:hypothetical protein AKG98_1177 [Moritella sp. JT01]|nr:hypothetical protein AKG98_1177 [Moritella sp. JT01]
MNYKKVLLGLILSSLSLSTLAAQVNISKVTSADSFVPGYLNSTLDRVVDSFSQALQQKLAQSNKVLVKAEADPALRQITKKSIARFEYRYTRNYKSVTQVYHSFSGETPLAGSTISEVDKASFNDLIEQQMRDNETLVTGKITEEEYEATGRYFRAASFARANDAEIKAMRRIEQDMLSGKIVRGGELTVYVNQIPCESCSPLFSEQLASWSEIESAEIAYLPQNRSYFGKTMTEEELNANAWYQHLVANDGLATTEAEEGLQAAFTSNRMTKTKFANFKHRYNNSERIRGSTAEVTGCGL